MEVALEARDIVVKFGGLVAVNSISFNIPYAVS